MDDITNEVLDQLTASCADCDITKDIIDKQSFSCFSESPSHVTYRARLEGTSETDSGSLISLIEEWVRGGVDIVVMGLLIKVDSQCLVEISSFSEGECSATTHSTADTSGNTITHGGIIGGAVAAILIVTLSITVAIFVIVVKCHHDREKNKTDM